MGANGSDEIDNRDIYYVNNGIHLLKIIKTFALLSTKTIWKNAFTLNFKCV